MNHKQFLIRGIILILVVFLTACAAPTATPSPTTAPLSCPTTVPQSCPTAAAQAPPTQNAWRLGYTGGIPTNVIITFDPGDKCSMKVITPISVSYFSPLWNVLSYDIVVNDQTYQNYVVWILTVDPGKTLADLEAVPPTSTGNPPSWVKLIIGDIVYPMTRTFHYGSVDITEGPLYFTCMVQGPGGLRTIGQLGSLEVPTK